MRPSAGSVARSHARPRIRERTAGEVAFAVVVRAPHEEFPSRHFGVHQLSRSASSARLSAARSMASSAARRATSSALRYSAQPAAAASTRRSSAGRYARVVVTGSSPVLLAAARADRDDGELAHVRVRVGLDVYGPVSAPVPAHTSHSRSGDLLQEGTSRSWIRAGAGPGPARASRAAR